MTETEAGPVGREQESGSGVRAWLGVYLRGFAMGTADAVPGVSGGTIALITGVYERLVDAVAGLDPAVVPDLVRLYDPAARRRSREALVAMDVPFLAVLAVGVLTGVVTLANAVEFAMSSFRAATFAFFFGLILASPVVLRESVSGRRRPLAAGAAGVVLAYWVGGLQGRLPDGPVVLFLVGAVAICAMVLPGISGSLILLTVGKYDVMVGAVGDLTAAVRGLVDGGTLAAAVAPTTTLAVFAAGALVGILSFARVVAWALDAYRAATMTFLVGLMFGALRRPAAEILRHGPPWTPASVAVVLGAGALGAAAVLGLERVTADGAY